MTLEFNNGPGPVRMPGRQTRPNPNPLPIR